MKAVAKEEIIGNPVLTGIQGTCPNRHGRCMVFADGTHVCVLCDGQNWIAEPGDGQFFTMRREFLQRLESPAASTTATEG